MTFQATLLYINSLSKYDENRQKPTHNRFNWLNWLKASLPLLQIKHAQNDLPPPEIFLHRLESIACLDGLQSGEQSSHLNRYLIITYSSLVSDTGRTDSSSSSFMPSKSLSVGVMAAKSSGMPVISTFWEYSPVLVL